MIYLSLSVIALALGPLLAQLGRHSHAGVELMDGYVLTAIGGLVLLFSLPHTLEMSGPLALLALLSGLILPFLLERYQATLHGRFLLLAFSGLALHAMMDGVGLVQGGGLALGVIIHRIPVGILIWWVLRPRMGRGAALGVIMLIAGATILGFGLGEAAFELASPQVSGLIQAMVAGAILHVLLHAHGPEIPCEEDIETEPESCHHEHGCCQKEEEHQHGEEVPHLEAESIMESCAHCPCEPPRPYHRWGGVGAILGVGTLLLLGIFQDHGGAHGGHGGAEAHGGAAALFLHLSLESAPALMLAFLAAGLLRAFGFSKRWLSKGTPLIQAGRGVLFGLPLPICSCGVLPLYEALIKAGVPVSAALAFLIATPELGLDALFLSWPLLGGEMTLIRLFSALFIALSVALLLQHLLPSKEGAQLSEEVSSLTLLQRLKEGLRYGLLELAEHILPWILVGLLLAALMDPLMDPTWLGGLSRFLAVPLMALLGLPVYVCASGATPMVAILMQKGLSAGAAIAFLLTGPATNLSTFGVLSRLHGRRFAFSFGFAVAGMALLLGWSIDLFMPSITPVVLEHEEGYSALHWISLGALALVSAAALLRRGPRSLLAEVIGHHR